MGRDKPFIEGPVITKHGLVLNDAVQCNKYSQQPAQVFIEHLYNSLPLP